MDKGKVCLEYLCKVEKIELRHNVKLANPPESPSNDRYRIQIDYEPRYVEIPKDTIRLDTHVRTFSEDDQEYISRMPTTIDTYLTENQNADLILETDITQNDANHHTHVYHLVGKDVTVIVELHQEIRKDTREIYGLSVHLLSGRNVDDIVEGIIGVVPGLERIGYPL